MLLLLLLSLLLALESGPSLRYDIGTLTHPNVDALADELGLPLAPLLDADACKPSQHTVCSRISGE